MDQHLVGRFFFENVRGHSGQYYNELADKLVTQGRRENILN